MNLRAREWTVVALALLLVFSCSKRSPTNGNGNGNGGEKDAEYYTAQGWLDYADGSYRDARNDFFRAVTISDSTYYPAFAGMGWCDIELGWTGGAAWDEFQYALGLDSSCVECYFGSAFLAHTQALNFPWAAGSRDWYQQAVLFGLEGLERGGDAYKFQHNPEVNARNLRVLLARTYYALGEYQDAHDLVNLLDPENTLNASSSNYLAELLDAIEDLEFQF